MSRIGKAPIEVPSGVTVTVADDKVTVKGPKGQLERVVHGSQTVVVEGSVVKVVPKSDNSQLTKFHGLTRSLVNNMVVGVSEGFTKRLTLKGVGYRGAAKGKGLNLTLGYSHPVLFDAPEGIELKMDGNTTVVVSGADKEKVGEVAATIRRFRPPEPYHGKGVRYENEHIVTKVGKAAGKK